MKTHDSSTNAAAGGPALKLYLCLPWIALLLVALPLAQEVLGYWKSRLIPLEVIHADSGFAHTAQLPANLARPAGRLGLLSVFEDGRPLSSITGDQNGVRQIGKGLYAVWDTTLYFSTSDNSDPATNHRSYTIAGPIQFPIWLVPTGLLLCALSYALVFFILPFGSNAARMARRWEWTALALILLIGGLWRAKLPSVSLAWPDSWNYVSMSFQWEARHLLNPTLRELCYQAFVLVVMQIGRSPVFLSAVQHAFGLAAAGFLFIAVRNMRSIVPCRPWVQGVAGLLALGSAMAWALSTMSIYYELYLMPEVVFHTLSAAALACGTAAFCATESQRKSALRMGVFASVSAMLMLIMYTTVPRWGFAVILAPLLLFFALRSPALSWKQRVGLGLTPFLIFLILVVIPNAWLHRKYEPRGNYFLHMHLLCIHADVVLAEIEHEATLPQPRFPAKLLSAVAADIQREIKRYSVQPNGPTPSLHFNADQLMYEDSVIAELKRTFGDDPAKVRDFALYFYFQAWRHQPLAMSEKIGRELAIVYADPLALFDPRGFEFIAADDVPVSRRVLGEHIVDLGGAGPWAQVPALLSRAELDRTAYSPPGFVGNWHAVAALAYLPVLIACGLLSIGVYLSRAKNPMATAWRKIAPGALLGFAAGFLSCLTIAVVHTLDPGRYRETLIPVSLFSVAAGSVALLVAVDSLGSWKRRPQEDSPDNPASIA